MARNEIKEKLLKKKQKEFFLAEILFELNKGEKLDQKLNLIKKTISEENFSKAALLYSVSDTSKNGGKLGWIPMSALNQKIKNEILNINTGDYTKPIVIPGGFLTIKINDARKIENNIDIKKEIDSVANRKTNEQLNQFSVIYFNSLHSILIG